jgi:hypothetical protein
VGCCECGDEPWGSGATDLVCSWEGNLTLVAEMRKFVCYSEEPRDL